MPISLSGLASTIAQRRVRPDPGAARNISSEEPISSISAVQKENMPIGQIPSLAPNYLLNNPNRFDPNVYTPEDMWRKKEKPTLGET